MEKVLEEIENGKLDGLMAKVDGWIAGGGLDTLADLLVNGVQAGAQKAGDMLQKAGDAMEWCQSHTDELKTGVKLLAVAFGLVKLAQFNQGLTNGATALFGMIKTVLTMTGVIGGQAAATGTATAAQTGLNAAMNANPIGAVILLVEGLITAGILLYKNWDTIKACAGQLWDKTKTVFSGIKDAITNAFSAAKEKVAGFFSWLDQKIESVPILGSIYKGGKTAVSWIADKLDGNAMGTPYWRGGYTRVNERGGEIMNLPSGTQIIPHDVSVKAAGGRSVTVNINIQGNLIGNREYTEQVGEYVGRKVLAALGNT